MYRKLMMMMMDLISKSQHQVVRFVAPYHSLGQQLPVDFDGTTTRMMKNKMRIESINPFRFSSIPLMR